MSSWGHSLAGNKPPRIFYGWIVLAACFAITLTLGEAFYAFGVFFKPLETEFGWSRAVTSSAYTTMLVGYAISAFLMGRWADRHGPRPVLIAGGLLTGLGFLLSSQVGNIWHFRALMALAGLGAGATWIVPAATVQRWFEQRRGLALGMMGVGVGVGATIFVPLTNFFVASFGWRMAFVLIGAIYLSIILAAASLVVHSPERKGLLPYGARPANPGAAPPSLAAAGFTTGQALHTRAFYILLLAVIIVQLPTQVMIVHLVPFAIDAGISAAVAATAMGLMGGFSIPGRLLGGMAADRLGWNKALAAANIAMGLLVLSLIRVNTAFLLFSFVFIYSLFHGGRNPPQWGIFSHFFGTRSLGELIGIAQALSILIGSAGPYLAGAIFDRTGSYSGAFLLVSFLFVTGGTLVLQIRPPRPL